MGKREKSVKLEVNDYKYLDPLEPINRKTNSRIALLKGLGGVAEEAGKLKAALARDKLLDDVGEKAHKHQKWFDGYALSQEAQLPLKDRMDPKAQNKMFRDEAFRKGTKEMYKDTFGVDLDDKTLAKFEDSFKGRLFFHNPARVKAMLKQYSSLAVNESTPVADELGRITRKPDDVFKSLDNMALDYNVDKVTNKDGADKLKRDIYGDITISLANNMRVKRPFFMEFLKDSREKGYINKDTANIAEEAFNKRLLKQVKDQDYLREERDNKLLSNAKANGKLVSLKRLYLDTSRVKGQFHNFSVKAKRIDEKTDTGELTYYAAHKQKMELLDDLPFSARVAKGREKGEHESQLYEKLNSYLPTHSVTTTIRAGEGFNAGTVVERRRPVGKHTEDLLVLTDKIQNRVRKSLLEEPRFKQMAKQSPAEFELEVKNRMGFNEDNYAELAALSKDAYKYNARKLLEDGITYKSLFDEKKLGVVGGEIVKLSRYLGDSKNKARKIYIGKLLKFLGLDAEAAGGDGGANPFQSRDKGR